jgi:hypothetical protein
MPSVLAEVNRDIDKTIFNGTHALRFDKEHLNRLNDMDKVTDTGQCVSSYLLKRLINTATAVSQLTRWWRDTAERLDKLRDDGRDAQLSAHVHPVAAERMAFEWDGIKRGLRKVMLLGL